jgi:hypothetical protein
MYAPWALNLVDQRALKRVDQRVLERVTADQRPVLSVLACSMCIGSARTRTRTRGAKPAAAGKLSPFLT